MSDIPQKSGNSEKDNVVDLVMTNCETNDLEELPYAEEETKTSFTIINKEEPTIDNDLEELPPDETIEDCTTTDSSTLRNNDLTDTLVNESLDVERRETISDSHGQDISPSSNADVENCNSTSEEIPVTEEPSNPTSCQTKLDETFVPQIVNDKQVENNNKAVDQINTQCIPPLENTNSDSNNINTKQINETLTTGLNSDSFEGENSPISVNVNDTETKVKEDAETVEDGQEDVKPDLIFHNDYYSQESDPDNTSDDNKVGVDTDRIDEKMGGNKSRNKRPYKDDHGTKLFRQVSEQNIEISTQQNFTLSWISSIWTWVSFLGSIIYESGKQMMFGGQSRKSSFFTSRWSDRDTEEYRKGYPGKKDDVKANQNLQFYQNKIQSAPNGDFIDNIHTHWKGDFGRLERHHGYIQWLFPIRESGLNWQAQALQLHEAQAIKEDRKAHKRVCRSYELMLDFYGMKLVDRQSGEVARAGNWQDRFHHLNRSYHNYLRITRILKSLGELGYEHFQAPFVKFIIEEACENQTLNERVLGSCTDYWLGTVKDDSARTELWHRLCPPDYVQEV